jgi:hypothetical protein
MRYTLNVLVARHGMNLGLDSVHPAQPARPTQHSSGEGGGSDDT